MEGRLGRPVLAPSLSCGKAGDLFLVDSRPFSATVVTVETRGRQGGGKQRAEVTGTGVAGLPAGLIQAEDSHRNRQGLA